MNVRVGDRVLRVKLDAFADIRPHATVRLDVVADHCMVIPPGGDSGTG